MLFAALGLMMVGAMFMIFDGSSDDGEGDGSDEARIDGTDADDVLVGNTQDNLITGYKGDDVLFGQDGDDTLRGYAGDDLLLGGAGDDLLLGGVGQDMLLGGDGVDTLDGGSGDDILIGAQVFAREFEPSDLDILPGDTLPDQSYEGDPEDQGNTLIGGDGNDLMLAGVQDTMTGGEGEDTFQVGEWVRGTDHAAAITDFDEEDDVLVVRYNPANGIPRITLGSEADSRLVFADGQLVARVQGDGGPFFASDVQLLAVRL